MRLYKDDKNPTKNVPGKKSDSGIEIDVGSEPHIKKYERLTDDLAQDASPPDLSNERVVPFRRNAEIEQTAFQKSLKKSFMRTKEERNKTE